MAWGPMHLHRLHRLKAGSAHTRLIDLAITATVIAKPMCVTRDK